MWPIRRVADCRTQSRCQWKTNKDCATVINSAGEKGGAQGPQRRHGRGNAWQHVTDGVGSSSFVWPSWPVQSDQVPGQLSRTVVEQQTWEKVSASRCNSTLPSQPSAAIKTNKLGFDGFRSMQYLTFYSGFERLALPLIIARHPLLYCIYPFL